MPLVYTILTPCFPFFLFFHSIFIPSRLTAISFNIRRSSYEMSKTPAFRVVVVGGGLVGLTAAHIFTQAGIDFVVLEKHDDPLCVNGSTLAIWPQTMRVFDQLGLVDGLRALLNSCDRTVTLSAADGRVTMTEEFTEWIKRNHGHALELMPRPKMVKYLWETLPESARKRVLLRKRVVDVQISDDGVKVSCDDGTTEEGSIVVGADGVRSRVRLLMRALIAGKEADELPESQKAPFKSTFRAYQKARFKDTQKMSKLSMENHRVLAWTSLYYKSLAKYGLPNLPLNKMHVNRTIAPLVVRAPVLDWLEEKERPPSRVPWKHFGVPA
ncbi:hypothetical protein F4778DRAFT_731046 [Xylariomycetidae sp. FL2044]|nr:hypothetical protein F4778DRAFT_731046 [Xylariomycetidae sp. FL2044]